MVRLFKTGWQGADFDPAQSVGCLGTGFNHWFGRGARLVLGGPYKHNRRAAGPRVRRPLSSIPSKPNRTVCELNQPPGGLAAGGRGLRECRAHFLHAPQLEAYWAVCWAELQARQKLEAWGQVYVAPGHMFGKVLR